MSKTQALNVEVEAQWKLHAKEYVRSAVELLAKELGVPQNEWSTSDVGSRISGDLLRFIQYDVTGKREDRYKNGDLTLVQEMATETRQFYTPRT